MSASGHRASAGEQPLGPFRERIERRQRFWWGTDWSRPHRQLALRLHRFRERYSWRTGDEPDARWHCCDRWQRTLMSKWNARQFARHLGCRVPALLWSGWRTSHLPVHSLPDCYVVKPNFGTMGRGVHVMAEGVELRSGKPCSDRELLERLREERGEISNNPILVEEFVLSEDGARVLPIEYKCHVFGDKVAAIQVGHRAAGSLTQRFYRDDWKPFDDPMSRRKPLADLEDPPRCFDELLSYARRLGAAYGTYVRVDLYASEKGCVFGEFAPTPWGGSGFTPFAQDYFEQIWQERLGDRL